MYLFIWDLPRSGIEPVSPEIQGGFFTTGSPEVSKVLFLKLYLETTFFQLVRMYFQNLKKMIKKVFFIP